MVNMSQESSIGLLGLIMPPGGEQNSWLAITSRLTELNLWFFIPW